MDLNLDKSVDLIPFHHPHVSSFQSSADYKERFLFFLFFLRRNVK